MGEKWPVKVSETIQLPRNSLGSFTRICRGSVTWDKGLYLQSEGRHAVDFFAQLDLHSFLASNIKVYLLRFITFLSLF
jgi:hypothetical protein